MARLFSPESRFYQALALAADIVVVNLLLIVSMIPVLSAGAGLRAATAVLQGLIRQDLSRPAAQFWWHFRQRPRASTLGWLIVLALGLLAGYEWAVISAAGLDGVVAALLRAGIFSALLLAAAVYLWLLVLETTRPYPTSFRQGLSHALAAAVSTLPRTLLGLLPGVFILAMPLYAPVAWRVLAPLWFALGPGFALYLALLISGAVRPQPAAG